jgi:hypothetical protein
MNGVSRGKANRLHGSIEPEENGDTVVLFGGEVLEAVCCEVLTALSIWRTLVDQVALIVDLSDTDSECLDLSYVRLVGAISRLAGHPVVTVDGFRTKRDCFFQVEAILGADDQRVVQLKLSVSEDSARIHCCDVGSGRAEVACTRLDRPTGRNVGLGRVFGLHDGLFAWGAWRRSQS